MPVTSEFDRFAGQYKKVLDRCLAISGETSEYFAEYKARYIATAVVPRFAGKVLDFGCGVGLLSGFLQTYLPAVTLHGFDMSAESIEQMDAKVRSHGIFTANLEQLDDDYGLIVLSNVVHHIHPECRQNLIVELRNRLSPAGRLVVFEHNPVNPLTRWVVSRCPFDEGAVLLPRAETMACLSNAGLHLVRQTYIVFFPRPLAWFRALERFLAWCPLGAQYVIVAEKRS